MGWNLQFEKPKYWGSGIKCIPFQKYSGSLSKMEMTGAPWGKGTEGESSHLLPCPHYAGSLPSAHLNSAFRRWPWLLLHKEPAIFLLRSTLNRTLRSSHLPLRSKQLSRHLVLFWHHCGLLKSFVPMLFCVILPTSVSKVRETLVLECHDFLVNNFGYKLFRLYQF